ncbi:MAG: DUF3887 domain-containing protein [Bacillota bacterium]|nr:DUF3887 domain-containing protein [Bacillota bacterium]
MKKLILILLLLLAVLGCNACSQNALADCFDEAEVHAKAEEIAMLVINRNYDMICSMFREDLAAELTPEYLASQLDAMLDENGEFEKFRATAAAGQKSADGEENYAIAMVLTKFEDGKRTFTITFDENMDLIGLYMK